ncbi:MAG TPA: hypothetical protein VGK99_15500 [Acidobacteriota bacterium]
MQDRQFVAQRAGCDKAVDAGANCQRSAASAPVKLNSLVKDLSAKGGLYQRQRIHRFAGDLEGSRLVKTVKHFLDYRQARDDILKVDN